MKLDFDINQEPPTKSVSQFTPIPPGSYPLEILETEEKQNKLGTGSYLAIRFRVVDTKHNGRLLFTNLTMNHKNPKAEAIGRGQLKALAVSAGLDLDNFKETNQLVGKHVVGHVEIKSDAEFGDRNNIRGFEALKQGSSSNSEVPF